MSQLLPTISALGTSWWIEIFDELPTERYTVIHDDCVAFLRRFEDRYSRFKPNSFLSQLNAAGRLNAIDREFQELLSFGMAQYIRTEGVFNIMVGETLVATGYDSSYSFIPQTQQPIIPNPYEVITLTTETITLANGHIDLGGFGKGYAIDRIAELLKVTHGVEYFLVNGGGDMFGTSDHSNPITIYLEHPTDPDTYLESTTLLHQGFAASSPHKRTWTHDSQTYSHIIHTKTTTLPTHTPDATFIKATTACDADIFATVALLSTPGEMATFAAREQLGVASFSLFDNSLSSNPAFH